MKKYMNIIKWTVFIEVLFSTLYSLALAFIPYIQKLLFDQTFGFGIKALLLLGGLYLSCVLLGAVFQYISQVYTWKTEVKFNLAIKADFFKAVSKYTYQKFAKRDTGEYISILNNDVSVLGSQYISAIVDIIKSSGMLVVSALFVFIFVDYRIASVILIASLLSVFVPKLMSKRLSKLRKSYQEQLGLYFAKVKDFWEGFKRINSVTQTNINGVHRTVLQNTEEKKLAFGKFKTLANIVNGFVMDFVNLSAFITVGYLLYKGEITIGTGIATFGYLESFIYPIRYILNDINDISASKETKDSVLSFMNEREENDLALMQRFEQSIAFENVEISFKDFAVRNFSYTFEKGKKYAIIGHSGSGKSTIVNALMKYTEIERGTIKIDGQSIQQTDLSSICCCIDQSFYTFADNFQNNVSTFHAYSTNHLEHLLGKYQWGKLKKIKDEDNMQSLSGGEKQMLHLLHLFTVNAPICLLDEPFSAMDAKMTGEMQKALLELTEQTVILVTHKITKEHLEEFDEIIIMENGFVVGAGTYKDIERSLAYMSLLKSA